MDNNFDDDILIAAVQSKPVLWDPSDVLYSKKIAKRDAWIDVCNEVISEFYDLPVLKQREYNDQLRSRWHQIRTAYRTALIRQQPFPRRSQLSFLNKLFHDISDKTSSNGVNLPNADDKNDEEMRRGHPHDYEKEESANANNSSNHLPEVVYLDPVLSIAKIDDQIYNGDRIKLEKHRKRKSLNPQEEVVPNTTKSVIRQETSARSTDDSHDEHSDRQECGVKRRRYRYEMQMASTRRNAARGQTSTYATVSFDDDRPLTEYTGVAHPHKCETFNGEPASEGGSSPPPPASRRQESCHNSQFPVIPNLPADYNDGDMAFFRSLLMWTRRFTEQETLEFRMEVMKLISRMRSYESAGNYYVISQTPLS